MLQIPQYVRKDMFILRHYQGLPYTVRSEKEMCTTKFEVVSPQSASCCNPMLKTIEIKYLISSGEHLHMTLNTPFQWKNELPTQVIALTITLKFGEGADEDKQSTTVDYCMELLSRDKYVEKAKESGLVSSLHRGPSLTDVWGCCNQSLVQLWILCSQVLIDFGIFHDMF